MSNSSSTYLVLSQRYQWYRKYRTDKHSVKFWTTTVTLTLSKAVNSFHKKLQCTICTIKLSLVAKDTVEMIIFDYMSWHCDLDLEVSKNNLSAGQFGSWWCMLGYKILNHSEDIIWTNIHGCMNHCCDLDLEHIKAIFSQDTLTSIMIYHQSKFAHKRINSS